MGFVPDPHTPKHMRHDEPPWLFYGAVGLVISIVSVLAVGFFVHRVVSGIAAAIALGFPLESAWQRLRS